RNWGARFGAVSSDPAQRVEPMEPHQHRSCYVTKQCCESLRGRKPLRSLIPRYQFERQPQDRDYICAFLREYGKHKQENCHPVGTDLACSSEARREYQGPHSQCGRQLIEPACDPCDGLNVDRKKGENERSCHTSIIPESDLFAKEEDRRDA